MRRLLLEAGWSESRMERAFFKFYDSKGKLRGVGGPHVDDFLCTGVGKEYERSLSKLKSSVSWGSWKGNEFSHCGKQVSRDGKDVLVSQDS